MSLAGKLKFELLPVTRIATGNRQPATIHQLHKSLSAKYLHFLGKFRNESYLLFPQNNIPVMSREHILRPATTEVGVDPAADLDLFLFPVGGLDRFGSGSF